MVRTHRKLTIVLAIAALMLPATEYLGAEGAEAARRFQSANTESLTLAGRSGEVSVERRGRIRRFSVTEGQPVEPWDVFRTGKGGRVSFTASEASFVLDEEATAAFDGRLLRLVQGRLILSPGISVATGPVGSAERVASPGSFPGTEEADAGTEEADVNDGNIQHDRHITSVIAGETLLEIAPNTVGMAERMADGSVIVSVVSGRVVVLDTRGRSVVVEPGAVGVLNATREELQLFDAGADPEDAVSSQVEVLPVSVDMFERHLFLETRSAFDERFMAVREARGVTDELIRNDGRAPIPEDPVAPEVADAAFEAAVLSLELERMTRRLQHDNGLVRQGAQGLLERRGRALRYIARLVQ